MREATSGLDVRGVAGCWYKTKPLLSGAEAVKLQINWSLSEAEGLVAGLNEAIAERSQRAGCWYADFRLWIFNMYLAARQ